MDIFWFCIGSLGVVRVTSKRTQSERISGRNDCSHRTNVFYSICRYFFVPAEPVFAGNTTQIHEGCTVGNVRYEHGFNNFGE